MSKARRLKKLQCRGIWLTKSTSAAERKYRRQAEQFIVAYMDTISNAMKDGSFWKQVNVGEDTKLEGVVTTLGILNVITRVVAESPSADASASPP